jgi:hypothetical protein
MKWVRHIRDNTLKSMLIVDDNVNTVIDHIWSTSKSIQPKTKKKDLVTSDVEKCRLDPGGVIFMKIPFTQFEIEEYKFEIQYNKVDEVRSLLKRGMERIPGYIRFPMWNFFIIVPKNIFNGLKIKLHIMSKSDKAFHAKIDVHEVKEDLEKQNICIFGDIPRESYNRKGEDFLRGPLEEEE